MFLFWLFQEVANSAKKLNSREKFAIYGTQKREVQDIWQPTMFLCWWRNDSKFNTVMFLSQNYLAFLHIIMLFLRINLELSVNSSEILVVPLPVTVMEPGTWLVCVFRFKTSSTFLSTVLLYCRCLSDSASVLLYFTFLSHLFPLPCRAGSTVPREGFDSNIIMPFSWCCARDTFYIASIHIQCQASIYTLSLCCRHSWSSSQDE